MIVRLIDCPKNFELIVKFEMCLGCRIPAKLGCQNSTTMSDSGWPVPYFGTSRISACFVGIYSAAVVGPRIWRLDTKIWRFSTIDLGYQLINSNTWQQWIFTNVRSICLNSSLSVKLFELHAIPRTNLRRCRSFDWKSVLNMIDVEWIRQLGLSFFD